MKINRQPINTKDKTLHLNLKGKYFQMIYQGIKKEEYRNISSYYVSRLFKFEAFNSLGIYKRIDLINLILNKPKFWTQKRYLKEFDSITFSNGYSKNRMQFSIGYQGLDVSTGRTEWGAEPGALYFTLSLGGIIRQSNF